MSLATGPNGDEGGSYKFYGNVNSYIEFPNNGGLDFQHSITMLCWLYPESNAEGPIFHYGPSGNWGVHIWTVPSGNIYVHYHRRDYSATGTLFSSQPLALNQWHYVGASYDYTTGTASLWVNGSRVAQRNIGAGTTIATQDNVRVGAKDDYNHFLTARVAAMQFYDVALTAEQIDRVKSFGLGKDGRSWIILLLCKVKASLQIQRYNNFI